MSSTETQRRPSRRPARRPSAASHAETAIRGFILDRGLRPGDVMPPEKDLCQWLGISRASLREAMRALSALGIVDVRQGNGTFVADPSMRPMIEGLVFRGLLMPGTDLRSLLDILDIRETLDLGLAERLTRSAAVAEDGELARLANEMDELSYQGLPFLEEDRAFHLALLRHTGNRMYVDLVMAFWEVYIRVSPLLGIPTHMDVEDTARSHRSILAAMEAGDVEAYRRAVADHYAPIRRVINTSTSGRDGA